MMMNFKKNKKAVIFSISLILAVVIGIVIIIGAISFISSPTIRYSLIGVGIAVGGFYVLGAAASSPQGLNGSAVSISVVIFVVALIVVFIPYSGLIQQQVYQCTGGQVLNVDEVKLVDSNELNQKVIRVTFSTIESGECLNIQLSEDEINNKLSSVDKSQFTPTNGIIGDIKLTKKQKVYQVNEDQTKIFRKLGLDKTFDAGGINPFFVCSINQCVAQFPELEGRVLSAVDLDNSQCGCLYETDEGINADFASSEQLQWEAEVNIGNDNLVLNQNNLSGQIGNIAFVKWAGNLLSNDNLGSINQDVYKPLNTNTFRVIDEGVYQDLNNKYILNKNILTGVNSNCGELTAECQTEWDNALDFNNEFNQKTTNKISTWISSETNVASAIFNSNNFIVDLNSPIAYPQFTLDIDADEVGIFIIKGEPKVTCPVNIDDLVSGETKDVDIKIENIGDQGGSFDYSLDCNTGSQVLQPSPPKSIGVDSSITITSTLGLTVDGSNGNTETSSCVFTATDLNGGISDSCTFEYTSTKQTQCIEGFKTCENGNKELWTCLSDGTYDKFECNYGCIDLPTEEAKCSDQEDSSTTNQCPWYQTPIVINTENCGLLSWKKLTNSCETNTINDCKTNSTLVLIFIMVLVIIIVAILIINIQKTNKKKK